MNVVFNPDFLDDIKKLGNSVKLIKYYLEDYDKGDSSTGYTLNDIINHERSGYYPKTYYGQGIYDDTFVRGIWDKDRKEFITHFSLPDSVLANAVRYDVNDEPERLEYEFVDENGERNGRGLIRIVRYVYNEKEDGEYKTAFLLTGNISGTIRNYIIDPIKVNQNKNLITISFPEDTKANILPYTIEDDTKFLENYGVDPGINIFLNSEEESLVSRDSFYKYLRVYTGDLQNFQTPYIDSSGKEIKRNYIYRDYKKLNIDCAGLFKYLTPNTRPSLSLDGGVLNIYGTAEYDEYILLGNELKFVGKGKEPINNIPNMNIEFSGNGELVDVKLDTEIIREESYSAETEVNKFRVSYGKYEGQEDPSKLVNFKLNFYDPFLNVTKEIKSKKIKITQLDTVLSEWEIYDRTTRYFEDEKPVYMFPWQSGSEHSFKIRTSLSNLSMNDFSMIYENDILNDLFKYDIEFIRDNREYPYYTYKITLINKTDNEDIEHWLPILNGESTILLATLRLNSYEYEESFYMVQSPKVDNIELHENPNNSNVEVIDFATDETERIYYPVAVEARTDDEIGVRNTWKVFSNDEDIVVEPNYGKLNPNNLDEFTREMKVIIERQSTTIEPLIFNDLIIGRIRENEVNMNLEEASWRNIINLSKISIPVKKDGIATSLDISEELIFKEINLYKVDISSNGPVACYLNYEEGFEDKFSFFDPYNNQITRENHFYNRDPEMPIYIALTDLNVIVEELIVVGKLEVVISEEEPDWRNGKPDIFNDSGKKTCIIYQDKHETSVNYINGDNGYVFLDSYTSAPVKYISTRTPERTITDLNSFLDQYRPFNNIVIERRDPIIEMNLEDGYLDHVDLLQNPNNLGGFYPISPAAIFTASQDYYNVSKSFFVFRKALGPDFYSNDTSYDRIIYLPANISGTDSNKAITIQSRYQIKDGDFYIRPLDENIQFSFNKTESVLDINDYIYKYNISITALSNNEGRQRTLGTFSMISRIYKERFINVNTVNSYGIPYYNFSQDEVDRIVPPRILNITVIQLGTEINDGDIELVGNEDLDVNVNGESRDFKIISDIEIREPNFSNVVNCEINNISTEGFTIDIPPRYDNFTPCVPNDLNAYSGINTNRNINVDVNITPIDPNYNEYNKTLTFIQPAITTGIIYGTSSETSLFIGDKNYRVVETVDSSSNSFLRFLGLFPINNVISNGTSGTLTNIEITSNSSENSYVILNEKVYWNEENCKENIKFTFPINNTGKTIERIYTIIYKVNNIIIHKITLVIEQQSTSGSFKCNNNMYVLSHGECLNKEENDLGWFDFETNIPIRELSISLSQNLLDQTPIFQEKSSGKYQVSIKLKPNLTEDKKTIILNFIRNGRDIIKSITVSQGYYCAKLYYPNSNNYIINNESIGSTSNYIDTPTRNEIQYGIRKLFAIDLTRCEPTIDGIWNYESELSSLVNIKVSNYTWTFLGIDKNENSGSDDNSNNNDISSAGNKDRTTNNYFDSYSSVIINSKTPYLENRYNVNRLYYGYEIKNKITVTLSINYPENDLLEGYYIEPVFNIFQNKLGE